MANTDQKTLDLIKEVNRQKAEIAKIEKSNWNTNCAFMYNEGSSAVVNLRVESDVKNLICIAAFLKQKLDAYQETADLLNLESVPEFNWQGFSVNDWIEDIKTRISKIQINLRKKKLETLESRLNAIISPELRAELELKAIEDALK